MVSNLPSIAVPTDLVNLALTEIGSRVLISNLATDTTAQAITARQMYTPRIQSLLRAANWDFARAQAPLTVWKAAIINGVTSSNPPPQPFLFSYIYPPDCLKVRFILPTVPVSPPGIPLTTAPTPTAWSPPVSTSSRFIPGTDVDAQGNPIKVILTGLPNAQAIYTRDLSQVPALWDSLFLVAATAYLAAYLINANARNGQQYQAQVAACSSILDQARVVNGQEAIPSIDTRPDWIMARSAGGNSGWNRGPVNGAGYGAGGYGGWDSISCPCGNAF